MGYGTAVSVLVAPHANNPEALAYGPAPGLVRQALGALTTGRQALGALPTGRRAPGALPTGRQAWGALPPGHQALGALPTGRQAQGTLPTGGKHGAHSPRAAKHGVHSPRAIKHWAVALRHIIPPHEHSLNLALLSRPPAGAHSDKEAPSDALRASLPSSTVSIPLLSGTRGKTLTVSSSSATATGPPLRTTWALHAPGTVAPPSDPTPPFKLATSFSPIPSKLVHKIQGNNTGTDFVEMRELLPDNIALGERLEALPNRPQTPKPTETREVSSLPTWVSVFATYVAIVADSHPTRVRDMMAYMRLIVREAMKHGETGWATYNQVFRRNNTGPDPLGLTRPIPPYRLYPSASGVVNGSLRHLQ